MHPDVVQLLEQLAAKLKANVYVGPFDLVIGTIRSLNSTFQRNPVILVIQPPGTSPSNLRADDSEFLSCQELAKRFGIAAEPLRRRLERWQKTHLDGWLEIANRRVREARYLYQLAAVRHLCVDLPEVDPPETR